MWRPDLSGLLEQRPAKIDSKTETRLKQLGSIWNFVGMFLRVLRGYILRALTHGTHQITHDLKNHQRDWGFLKNLPKDGFLCSWWICPNYLVDKFIRGPSTYPNSSNNPKFAGTPNPSKLVREGEGKRKNTNDSNTRSCHTNLEEMISLLPRSTMSSLTHRQWFQSLIWRVSVNIDLG